MDSAIYNEQIQNAHRRFLFSFPISKLINELIATCKEGNALISM